MSKIGLVSDTHDNLPNIEKAVKFFNEQRVDFVLHAGDFIAPFSILKLKSLLCDWVGVFGNNDGEKNGLCRVSEGKIKEGPLRMKLIDLKIALVHDISTIDLKKEDASLVIFGHTHKPQILKRDHKLLINPGEAGGWLTAKSTVALLDLDTLKAKIVKI